MLINMYVERYSYHTHQSSTHYRIIRYILPCILLFSPITWWNAFKLSGANIVNPFNGYIIFHGVDAREHIQSFSVVGYLPFAVGVCMHGCAYLPLWTMLLYIYPFCIGPFISWNRFPRVDC